MPYTPPLPFAASKSTQQKQDETFFIPPIHSPNSFAGFSPKLGNPSGEALKHTFGHIDCPACELTRDNIMGFDPDSLAALPFSEASQKWLETRRRYLRTRTAYGYQRHIDHLARFFGPLPLRKIHLGHLRQYQTYRQINACAHGKPKGTSCDHGCVRGLWDKKAGPSLINHEISNLQSILKRAGRWEAMEEHYEALPLPAWRPPKTMTDEEEMRLFAIASSREEWELAYFVANISRNTTATGTELRNLQMKHLLLDAKIPSVLIPDHAVKNQYRARVIALNSTGQNAFRWCVERARRLGSAGPDHYLFPFRVHRGLWDPTRPASSSWLRRSWSELREAAGLPWLTPHCLRHQCITLMYEMGVDEQTIMHTAGHQSPRMSRYYSHNRRSVQKSALDLIDPANRFGPEREGYRPDKQSTGMPKHSR